MINSAAKRMWHIEAFGTCLSNSVPCAFLTHRVPHLIYVSIIHLFGFSFPLNRITSFYRWFGVSVEFTVSPSFAHMCK